ncbi:hypothetical protein ACC791_37020, partial [Rhizobium ruizarguesonis]
FVSKEALYAEALRHYRDNNEALVWAGFFSAGTAREAVKSFLMDSAAALTGCFADIPRGCMVALSSVETGISPSDIAWFRRAFRRSSVT